MKYDEVFNVFIIIIIQTFMMHFRCTLTLKENFCTKKKPWKFVIRSDNLIRDSLSARQPRATSYQSQCSSTMRNFHIKMAHFSNSYITSSSLFEQMHLVLCTYTHLKVIPPCVCMCLRVQGIQIAWLTQKR